MEDNGTEAKLYSLEMEYNKLLLNNKSAYEDCIEFIQQQIKGKPESEIPEEISVILAWLHNKIK